MSELAHQGDLSASPGEIRDYAPTDWAEVVEEYSSDLQLERQNEGEGYIDALEGYIRERVFKDPEAGDDVFVVTDSAVGLYAALAASADPYVHQKAADAIDNLSQLAPDTSKQLLEALMAHPDDSARSFAFHLATQYG